MLAARLSECYWWEKPAANENVRRRNHLFESDTAGNTTTEYIWLGNQRLAKVEGGNVYFMHTDHLGTVQLLTNNTGAVVWSGDYKPFGEVAETVNSVANNLRFPGQYYDAESGLQYNYFRDYDPSIGRYVESDFIGLGGGVNTYLYVVANPLNFLDLIGLASNCQTCKNNCKMIYERDIKDLDEEMKSMGSGCGVSMDGGQINCGAIAGFGVLVFANEIKQERKVCLNDCAKGDCKPCNN